MNFGDRQYFNLLREISFTQFKIKDQSTFFGFFWSFLHPLLLLSVLVLVFSFRFGQEVKHYPVFVLIGIIQYAHFSNCTNISMKTLRSMGNLTCNVIFPKELMVIGSVLGNSVEFVLSMIICIFIAYFLGVNISWAILLFPVIFVFQLILVLWISIVLSCLYIFIKDIGHIYQVFLRILFFSTPIFYSLSSIENNLARKLISLNPLTYLISFSRDLIIDGKVFSFKVAYWFFFLNIILLYGAIKLFRKIERNLAEYV